MPSTEIHVTRTYFTKTPIAYVELSGDFRRTPIVIGVTLFGAGNNASISGVLTKGTVDEHHVKSVPSETGGGTDHERRILVKETCAWHASLRTDRKTLNALLEAQGDPTIVLSWEEKPKHCAEERGHQTFFGDNPKITFVEAASCDR